AHAAAALALDVLVVLPARLEPCFAIAEIYALHEAAGLQPDQGSKDRGVVGADVRSVQLGLQLVHRPTVPRVAGHAHAHRVADVTGSGHAKKVPDTQATCRIAIS